MGVENQSVGARREMHYDASATTTSLHLVHEYTY
jgi:hypothetical protein